MCVFDIKWTLIAEQDKDEILALSNRLLKLLTSGLIFGAFLFSILAYFIASKISRPITRLQKATTEIEQGNYNVQVDDSRNDELGALGALFNIMTKELQRKNQKLLVGKDKLEMQVAERTEELSISNDALKVNKDRLYAILDNSTTVVSVKDVDGRYQLINSSFEKLLNINKEKVIGKTDHDIFPKELADTFRANDMKVIESKSQVEFEEVTYQDDGNHTYLSIKFPLYDSQNNINAVCGISTDITEHLKIEDELLKVQKLESLGILAGGIAHDFNNLLTSILGNISLMKLSMKPEDKLYKRVEEAEKASVYAGELTKQLLTFSKGGAPMKETIELRELIEEATKFSLHGSNIACETNIAPDLCPVAVDKGQISQTLNNLIINAKQSMPGDGKIIVNAGNCTIKTENALPLKEGEYIKISIIDHGMGIPAEILTNIFDPYFTTKTKGSGIRLASAYAIINKHGGI